MNAVEFQALGDPRGGDHPTAGKADDLVTDLSPDNKPPKRRKPEPDSPYVTTQREREQRGKKLLEED